MLRYLQVLLLILITSSVVNAITLDEQIKIRQEAQAICYSLHKPCSVSYFESYIPQGYTTYTGDIKLSTGLTNYLNYDETRAVVLHEIGHHVLNHYRKQDKFLLNWNLSQKELQAFRHNNEFEADMFATKYYKIIKQKNYLPQALTKLTAPDKLNLSTTTHPSTNQRIERINNNDR